MKMLLRRLGSRSNLAILFALFLLFIVLLNYYMPRSLALDVKFAYTADEAYTTLKSMGPALRAEYLYIIWVLDSTYMVIYLLLFSSLIVKFLNNKLIAILPLLIFIFDLLENIMVTSLLLKYPTESHILGFVASFFTTTKWLIVAVFWITFLGSLLHHYLLKNQPNLDLKR
ncbi:hypothetical protein [Algoriphagus sp.]|uniref:hypothetical protein n=1 Tax=Algoriphagus sp. TaxID=1872435 RepID=UPI00329477A0